MSDPSREASALDALIASYFRISEDDELFSDADLEILSDEDRAALEALGFGLTDRLLSGRTVIDVKPPPIVKWTAEAVAELERHRRELEEDEFEDFDGD